MFLRWYTKYVNNIMLRSSISWVRMIIHSFIIMTSVPMYTWRRRRGTFEIYDIVECLEFIFYLYRFFFFFNVLVISTYIRHLVCKYLLIYLPEIEMLIFVSHMKYKYYILWLINLKILNCRHRRIIYYLYCCMYCTVYTQEMFKTVLNHYLLSGT